MAAAPDVPGSPSLRARLTVVAGVLLLLLLSGAGGTALVVRHWSGAVEDRRLARVAVQDLAELRLAYSDQETGVRGFVLAGGSPDIAPYRRGDAAARRALQDLRANAAGDGALSTALGAFADASWTTATTTVAPGATLVLHTDGVTEACGPDRERFGEDRLRALLQRLAGGSAATMVGGVVQDVDDYGVGVRSDDVSVVALRRTRPGEQVQALDTREDVHG